MPSVLAVLNRSSVLSPSVFSVTATPFPEEVSHVR